MRWYLNDRSLQAQFNGKVEEFLDVLIQLNTLKSRHKIFMENFHITPNFVQANVMSNKSVYTLLTEENSTKLRNEIDLIFGLISTSRPFVDEGQNELNNGVEFIEFEGIDVKNTAMELAANEIIRSNFSSLFSFKGGGFEKCPLITKYWSGTNPAKFCEIENFWELSELEKHVRDCKPKNSWDDAFKILTEELKYLVFRDDIFKDMKKHFKFNKECFGKIYDKLKILNQFMCIRNLGLSENSDEYIETLNKIIDNRKHFSSETESNKGKFDAKLNFKNINGKIVFAPWHAKFKQGNVNIRIHFEWEVKKDKEKLEIFYIGRKLTEKTKRRKR